MPLGLRVYSNLKSRALSLPCLYKAKHCRAISAENQSVFYQMPGQQVELMYRVRVVKPLGSSDSLELCSKGYTYTSTEQSRDPASSKVKPVGKLWPLGRCYWLRSQHKDLSPTFPSEVIWSGSPSRTDVRKLRQWSGSGWEDKLLGTLCLKLGLLTCDIIYWMHCSKYQSLPQAYLAQTGATDWVIST